MVTFISHFKHVGISICLLGLKLTIHNVHESAVGVLVVHIQCGPQAVPTM